MSWRILLNQAAPDLERLDDEDRVDLYRTHGVDAGPPRRNRRDVAGAEARLRPPDHTGAQLLFRFVAAAYERRALGVASHWPFEEWGRFLRLAGQPTLP